MGNMALSPPLVAPKSGGGPAVTLQGCGSLAGSMVPRLGASWGQSQDEAPWGPPQVPQEVGCGVMVEGREGANE